MYFIKKIIKIPYYSYGKYIYNNPKRIKKKRIQALEIFLNKTRK